MKKTLTTIISTIFLSSLISIVHLYASEYENKEALQMYSVENTLAAINKSRDERKNHENNNERNIASTTNQDEFEELMNRSDEQTLFDEIDQLDSDSQL